MLQSSLLAQGKVGSFVLSILLTFFKASWLWLPEDIFLPSSVVPSFSQDVSSVPLLCVESGTRELYESYRRVGGMLLWEAT